VQTENDNPDGRIAWFENDGKGNWICQWLALFLLLDSTLRPPEHGWDDILKV